MSNLIDLNAFRKERDRWDRICDEESIDVFMAAFWHQSAFAELLDSPNLRRRTAEALMELRDFLRSRDNDLEEPA
jgi:hypothetical protein